MTAIRKSTSQITDFRNLRTKPRIYLLLMTDLGLITDFGNMTVQ